MAQTPKPIYRTQPPKARKRPQSLASAGSAGQGMFRVKYRTNHAKQSKKKDPPNIRGLWDESQINCGTLEVRDDKAAPIPSVIITAGNVQQIRVERLVTKAIVGAAVSLKASLVLRIV